MLERKPLPNIWDVPDDPWERIEPVILELDPLRSKGRKRVDQRKMRWKGPSFGRESVASGTTCPRSWGTIALYIGSSSAG